MGPSRASRQILKNAGLNLRALREQKNLSQESLAELADVHDRTIGSIERGRLNFSVIILMKLCEALDCSPQDILQ